MNRFFIEDVRVMSGQGGLSTGLPGGQTIVEIRVRREDEVFYLSLADVMGYPFIYHTKRSTIEEQLEEDWSPEFDIFMAGRSLEEGDYEDVLADREHEFYSLFRYLIYMVHEDWEDEDNHLSDFMNCYVEDLHLPAPHLEVEYL